MRRAACLGLILVLPAVCPGQVRWELGNVPGFGDPDTFSVFSFAVYDGALYAGTHNEFSGCGIWRFDGPRNVDWTQVNSDGFGTNQNWIAHCMAVYNGRLYVGTRRISQGFEVWAYDGSTWTNVAAGGLGDASAAWAQSMAVYDGALYLGSGQGTGRARVHRYDGSSWAQANVDSFGEVTNSACRSMAVYNGALYAGTFNGSSGGQVWRYDGPGTSDWTRVATDGFGAGSTNRDVRSMAVYNGELFAGTASWSAGCQIWEYDGGSWTRNDPNPDCDAARSMVVADGKLYVGTGNAMGDETGCQIWQYDGTNWAQANLTGFGDAQNQAAHALAAFDGHLYAGVANWYFRGGQAWRTRLPVAPDPLPLSWGLINVPGYGDTNNFSPFSLAVYDGRLHAGTLNNADGCELWRFDGPRPTDWTQVNTNGFDGNSNWIAHCLAVYDGSLYAGTRNTREGFEVWRYDGTNWADVATGGLGDTNAHWAHAMAVHDGALYLGAGWAAGRARIHKFDGSAWTQANADSFGAPDNEACRSLGVFAGKLYAGTYNGSYGGQVWRLDGTGTSDWTRVATDGFGVGNDNEDVRSLAAYAGRLFAGTANTSTGCQIWEYDGSDWTRNDPGPLYDAVRSMLVAGGKLYVGTGNYLGDPPGCQIWEYDGTNWAQVNPNGFGDEDLMAAHSLAALDGAIYAGVADMDDRGGHVWRGRTNDPPVCSGEGITALADVPVTIDVLANDTDPNGDVLTVTNVTQGAHGTASVPAGGTNVLYTPDSGYSGPDSVVYAVTDGYGSSDTGTVTIQVLGNNPFRFRATALTNSVVLRWSDPLSAGISNQTVHIRCSTNDYPGGLSDGQLVYENTAQTTEHTNLVPYRTYYYTIWVSHDGTTFIEPPP
ncbi:MAG: cadherin-like domain-containing protein [Kiritimatiellae bacterium]|nr:cadherin-like domain-containing protein [Kiritimatiellia bacterium]